MSERADLLRLPEGLGEYGEAEWRRIAPILWKAEVLTLETRSDIEAICRYHQRSHDLAARPDDPDEDPDAGIWEMLLIHRIELALRHRYALTPRGRAVMESRGWPGTPNPMPRAFLCACEGGEEVDPPPPSPWPPLQAS